MKSYLLIPAFLVFSMVSIFSQDTLGLKSYEPWDTYDGYNLIYPHNQDSVFLLDMCGKIVHFWEGEQDWRPANTAYLQDDGSIIKTSRFKDVVGNPIWAGGGGGTISRHDWDNNLIWTYTLNDENFRLHHDIAVMPNGHVLAIAWEEKNREEAIQAGRDTAILALDKLWPDMIIEYAPELDSIAWEWHAWDHLIQDFDATKDNFGVIADNPRLIDLNFDTNDGNPDWLHGNSLDYNEDLDQILISIPQFHEVWIIDHSTTTAQAASSSGGNFGRGGDLIYRWGNPITYGGGTSEDQQLFYQHDAHWIDDFVEEIQPEYGLIGVFNNRVGADYSTANIFNPIDMYTESYTIENGQYLPVDFVSTFTHPDTTSLYSTGLSSYQLLPNGNSLICSGRFGYAFELNRDGQVIWEYTTPLLGGTRVDRNTELAINNNLTFRMDRYPLDYEAFDGKNLSFKGYIELNPDNEFCDLLLPTNELEVDYHLEVFPNPVSSMLMLDWDNAMDIRLDIYNLMGQRLKSYTAIGGRKYLDVSNLQQGTYIIQVNGRQSAKFIKF